MPFEIKKKLVALKIKVNIASNATYPKDTKSFTKRIFNLYFFLIIKGRKISPQTNSSHLQNLNYFFFSLQDQFKFQF